MKSAIGLLLLVAVIGIGAYVGCGPRGAVAKDKVINKIDEMLGKLNVKLKTVEMAYDELDGAIAGMRDKRIEAQVRLKNHKAKDDDYSAQAKKLKADLTKLKDLLGQANGSESVDHNGKAIPIEKLDSLAKSQVKQLKLVQEQKSKNDIIMAAWAKNLDLLKKNEDTSKSQMSKLESQLDQIRSKKSSLDAMKEAQGIAGPGVSISDKFNELTADVDELLVNVDTEWAIEEAKLDERIADVEQDTISIDELLDEKTDVSDTMSEIDKLLGNDGDE